ncbi:hypothetical protein GIB67_021407, partial [Kingdonia uniflora]
RVFTIIKTLREFDNKQTYSTINLSTGTIYITLHLLCRNIFPSIIIQYKPNSVNPNRPVH